MRNVFVSCSNCDFCEEIKDVYYDKLTGTYLCRDCLKFQSNQNRSLRKINKEKDE